jgi:hypothetical protein
MDLSESLNDVPDAWHFVTGYKHSFVDIQITFNSPKGLAAGKAPRRKSIRFGKNSISPRQQFHPGPNPRAALAGLPDPLPQNGRDRVSGLNLGAARIPGRFWQAEMRIEFSRPSPHFTQQTSSSEADPNGFKLV